MAEKGIDHLLYATSNLQRGMDEIEALLGVRPVPGGNHPQYGTKNALLSLGTGIYLEVIARDPDLPAPDRGALFDIPEAQDSRLVAWVYRVTEIQESADALKNAGIVLGTVDSGQRAKPDGSVVRWEMTDPYTRPLNGAVPFLIDWGDTPHPSTAVPPAGRLVQLAVAHPDPEAVESALSVLGAQVKVAKGDRCSLSATIETTDGYVTIR